MKAKKTPSRRRISFAVDREEIEINSDWVEAVMASPAPPSAAPFFAPDENSSTDARCTSVENAAAVVEIASVDDFAPVAESATVEGQLSIEEDAPVANIATVRQPLTVEQTATVESHATDDVISTGALSSSTKDHRIPRPRLILRVTDGLTPGQYAVYSLMYEAGEGSEDSARIYNGGYADLGRLTGLSKRGLQHIIAELQAKHVISVHRQPGYHRTQTSAYRVPSPQSVLDRWLQNGWRHAIGKSKTLTG